MTYYYTGKLNSDVGNVGCVIQTILGKLDEIVPDENLLFDIRLILNELVINGCKHGNNSDISKWVRLSLMIKENRITIRVVDEGEGIRYKLVDYNPTSMETTGRGLRIVQELADELIIDRNSVVAIINK